MQEPMTEETVLAQARERLTDAMRKRGLSRMTATFSGSGDEGYVDDAEFFTAGAEEAASRSGGERWITAGQITDAELDDLAYAYCNDLIYVAGIAGYEINEGGGGSIELDLEARKESISSYYYVEHTEDGPSEERTF